MLMRKIEELQKLLDVLRNLIENEQTIQVTLDKDTLIHIHESVLLSKMIFDRVHKINRNFDAEWLADELKEMKADFYSEGENVVYDLIDKILKNEYIKKGYSCQNISQIALEYLKDRKEQ